MMKVDTYRLFLDMAAALRPLSDRIKKDPDAKMMAHRLENHIKEYRRQIKRIGQDPLGEIKEDIRQTIQHEIKRDREKIFINVSIGKPVFAEMKKETFKYNVLNLTVGWMWKRKVYPIYQDGFRNRNWFILSAEEYRINQSKVRLWECNCFNFIERKMIRIYLSKSEYGVSRYFLAKTATAAIKAAFKENQNQINKRLTGED